MKKLFLIVASFATLSVLNAQQHLDFTTLTSESDWIVNDATKNSTSTDKKLVYDVAANTPAVVMPACNENIEFSYENTSAKEKAFTIALGDYFEFAGKNGVLTLYGVQVGTSIKIYVAGKSDKGASSFVDPAEEPRFPEGATPVSTDLTAPAKNSNGYTYVTLEYTATSSEVKIKEFAYGYRIQWIEATFETSALANTEASVKAVKTIENGQLVIIKNGVRYNLLGAEIR